MSIVLPRELLKGEDAPVFIEDYKSCREMREVLAGHLKMRVESLIIEDECRDQYSLTPSLSLSHADNVGMRRGIREAIKLLTGDK